jgi:hypothetical protein
MTTIAKKNMNSTSFASAFINDFSTSISISVHRFSVFSDIYSVIYARSY